jgi:hypothetical protein
MINPDLLEDFRAYLKENYGSFRHMSSKFTIVQGLLRENTAIIEGNRMKFEELVNAVHRYIKTKRSYDTFNKLLNEYMAMKGMTDSELYKKAFIDRRVYSRLATNPRYHPGKRTIITLGLALELDIGDMTRFLESAGFCFNTCAVADLAVMYCVEHEIYDIYMVNALLVEVGEKVLHKE